MDRPQFISTFYWIHRLMDMDFFQRGVVVNSAAEAFLWLSFGEHV